MYLRPALLFSTLTLACAIFPAVQAFQFTAPDSAEKLDMSKNVTVSWDANRGSLSEPGARAVELWFYADMGDGVRLGWQLAKNLSLSDINSFEWDPSDNMKSIEDYDGKLSPDAVHTFEARLLSGGGSRLATVQSDNYTLEGFDFIESGGGRAGKDGIYMAASVALVWAVLGGL